jgi:S1-C subfamily serine protease
MMRPLSPLRRRIVTLLAIAAWLVVPGVVGYEIGRDDASRSSADATASVPDRQTSPSESGDDAGTGDDAVASQPGDPDAIARAVAAAVVNITTTVEGGGRAAGTGIVISRSGLVVTNRHVISGATAVTVEFGASGTTRSARVLGYSVVDDVALLQVQNVSDLDAAEIGTSTSLSIGDLVVALGNAGGRGGSPTVVSGTVTGLDEQITASNADGSGAQTLDGLIELAADIRSGDSGGPVVDDAGKVVGMSVAASVDNGFGRAGRGYAIPIEDVVAIAKKISSKEGGPTIRVGATRAVLGVQIQPDLASSRRVPGGLPTGTGGALVLGVEEGSGASRAGLAEGDVIVGLGGRTITASRDVVEALVAYSPGDKVEVTWRDRSGATQRAMVALGEGPPA